MRFATTIAVLASVAYAAASQELDISYIASMLSASKNDTKPAKKPSKLNWVQTDAVTLITDAWGIPYLTAQADPSGNGFVIGYGHVGKDVKAKSVVTEDQADSILLKDLKAAVSCYQSTVWNQYWRIPTEAQNTAMVSFIESIGCTAFKKLVKGKFTKSTVAADLNGTFESLIAAADAGVTASNYLTSRRAAEKALFGIA